MMDAKWLSFKGQFCPSYTPNRKKKHLFRRKNRLVQSDSLKFGSNRTYGSTGTEMSGRDPIGKRPLH
jgi:hypothetical protein